MARKKIIAGNWKMNMTPSEAVKLVEDSETTRSQNDEVDVVLRCTGYRHRSCCRSLQRNKHCC